MARSIYSDRASLRSATKSIHSAMSRASKVSNNFKIKKFGMQESDRFSEMYGTNKK
jgi:hypothetical protein